MLFFLGKTDKMLPKSRFSKPIFGHSAGSTKLDRPYCKRFWNMSQSMTAGFLYRAGAQTTPNFPSFSQNDFLSGGYPTRMFWYPLPRFGFQHQIPQRLLSWHSGYTPLFWVFLPWHIIFAKDREVPNGVGADGVGVKFPIFPVNCSRLPLSQKNRRKTKKNEEKRRKTKKMGKSLRPHLHQPH